jgi:VWFA-related protein
MNRLRTAFLTVFVVLLPACAASGFEASPQSSTPSASQKESAAPSQELVLRLEVNRVPLDVVVTDRQGNPVRGLKKDDFTVKEDGKKQRIQTFEYEDGSAPSYIPPKLPSLPANTYVNVPGEPEQGPLYVLYFDMLNMSRDDQMSFHGQLLDFVDKAPAGTRFALFANTNLLHLIQGFTGDRARLREAILSQGPGPHIPKVFLGGADAYGPGEYGAGETGKALWNLNLIADYLSGFPGRKNLIWLSGGFPIPVGPSGEYITDPLILQNDAIKHTYDALLKSQIAIYPVDVRGVLGSALGEFQDEDDIAKATGGHAYHGNNRARALMDQAVTHGARSYSMSYSPSNRKYDGLERHIEVTLARKGDYELSYRRFYYAAPEAAGRSDTLFASMEHGAPMMHDLLFSAHLTPKGAQHMATEEQMRALEESPAFFRTRRKNRAPKPLAPVKLQTYRIQYGVFDSHLKTAARRKSSPPVLEFAVAAYDADGRLLNGILNDGVASPEPDASGKLGVLFHAEQELDVPPGAASLRMVIRDTVTDRTGAMEVSLPLKAETAAHEASKADLHQDVPERIPQ